MKTADAAQCNSKNGNMHIRKYTPTVPTITTKISHHYNNI
jgi:hypothetical protein